MTVIQNDGKHRLRRYEYPVPAIVSRMTPEGVMSIDWRGGEIFLASTMIGEYSSTEKVYINRDPC